MVWVCEKLFLLILNPFLFWDGGGRVEEGAAGEDFELFLPGAATYVAPTGRGGPGRTGDE